MTREKTPRVLNIVTVKTKEYFRLVNFMFATICSLASTLGKHICDTAVPIILLSYGVIVFISNILLGAEIGLVSLVMIPIIVIITESSEIYDFIQNNTAWKYRLIEFEKYFNKIRYSEVALKKERDLLENEFEEKLRELKASQIEKISQLYKFIEFGRLASGIFHDLLNPLSVMSLSMEKIGDKTKDEQSHDIKMHIDQALTASKRIDSFVRVARKQLDGKNERSDFSVNAEINDAINMLGYKIKKSGVKIDFNTTTDSIIFGEAVKFFQVIVNLISNAIDSYDCIANDNLMKSVVVTVHSTDEIIHISVKDSGCGIRDDIKKLIFEPFFTTKQNGRKNENGFGLGLSTSKNVVEKEFGGKIEVESAQGKGSLFKVSVPRRKTIICC